MTPSQRNGTRKTCIDNQELARTQAHVVAFMPARVLQLPSHQSLTSLHNRQGIMRTRWTVRGVSQTTEAIHEITRQ